MTIQSSELPVIQFIYWPMRNNLDIAIVAEEDISDNLHDVGYTVGQERSEPVGGVLISAQYFLGLIEFHCPYDISKTLHRFATSQPPFDRSSQ